MYVPIVATGTQSGGRVQCVPLQLYYIIHLFFFVCLKSPSSIHTQTKIQNSVDTYQIALCGQIV